MKRAVTTFPPKAWDQYARRMITSFLEHWPEDMELWAYYEGERPGLRHERLRWKALEKVPGHREVTRALKTFAATRGLVQPGGSRNYRYDAAAFVHKVFAQCDAATNLDGVLVWVDADTYFTGAVEHDWLDDQLGGHFMAYQGRSGWHSCASFVMWDMAHDQAEGFFRAYFELVVSGRFLLLPEWHDSFWLDTLREALELDATNITPPQAFFRSGPVNVFDAVFEGRGHHLKGNLKRGPARYRQLIDLVAERQPKLVIEIGTWNGDRAIQMAQVSPGMQYVGFDLFEEATVATDEREKNVKPHHAMADVAKKLREAGVSGVLFRGDTRETLPRFVAEQDVKADLIYIDGGHAVETIRSDLEHALKLIKPGGLIVLDDWYEDMPEEELARFGCQAVLPETGLKYEVLPVSDPVKGGGVTKMAVVRC